MDIASPDGDVPGFSDYSTKTNLRRRLLAARAARSAPDRQRAGVDLAKRLFGVPHLGAGSTVAAYVAVGTEPPTAPLLAALAACGVRVLLPVLLPDHDLDWAEAGQLRVTGRGLREPVGPTLGVSGLATADVVVVPALACDHHGARLGRGGGSYDRALPRVRAGVPLIAMVYDDELLTSVPAEPHDVRVGLVATPSQLYVAGSAPGGRSDQG